MPATTQRTKWLSNQTLRAMAALVALAIVAGGLTVFRLQRQGYYFRDLNPRVWALRSRGVYYYDAEHSIFRQARTTRRLIALTFDDGPHASSPALLDVLKRYNAHATFFLVGSNVIARPGDVRRMLADGHEVGNHTRTHLRLPPLRDDQIRGELNNDTIVIARATGHRVRLFRPPGGQYDDRVTAEAARQGMLTVLWSNNTGDWQAKDPGWIVNRVLSSIEPGDVILMHEDMPQTLAAMPGILEGLRARGYQAVTVTDLLRENKLQPPPISR